MAQTGYYDVNRGLLSNALAPPSPGYVDPNSPYPFSLSGYDITMSPDPSMGTDVVLPSGTKHFAPNQPPWIGYIAGKNNDQPVAAVEGSDEASHYQRQMNTARNQSIIEMLALAAGGATAAGAAPWSSGAAAGTGANAGAELSDVVVPSAGNYLPAIGGGGAGGAAAGAGLSDVAVPSAGAYLGPVGAGGEAGAATGPPSSLAGSATSMVPPEGTASSGGWQQQIRRLFHMGGSGQQQRQPYHYQSPQVADYAQQQQAAEMLAEALNKKQPIDPIVRGGPIPVGRY